jgi:hypothetical protein
MACHGPATVRWHGRGPSQGSDGASEAGDEVEVGVPSGGRCHGVPAHMGRRFDTYRRPRGA